MSHYVIGRPTKLSGTMTASTGLAKIPHSGGVGFLACAGASYVLGRMVAAGTALSATIKALGAYAISGYPGTGQANITATATATSAVLSSTSIDPTLVILPGMSVFQRGVGTTQIAAASVVLSTTVNSITLSANAAGGANNVATFDFAMLEPAAAASLTVTPSSSYTTLATTPAAGAPLFIIAPATGYGPVINWPFIAIEVVPTASVVYTVDLWPVYLSTQPIADTSFGIPVMSSGFPATVTSAF